MIATTINISRTFLPFDILATNKDTKGPNPINHPKKNSIKHPSHTSTPRNVVIFTKSIIYVQKEEMSLLVMKGPGPNTTRKAAMTTTAYTLSLLKNRSEERRVGKECRTR